MLDFNNYSKFIEQTDEFIKHLNKSGLRDYVTIKEGHRCDIISISSNGVTIYMIKNSFGNFVHSPSYDKSYVEYIHNSIENNE
jgi:hypothetical protein